MQKYFIQTFGCQMNYSDTERMETYIEALGYKKTAKMDDADVIIFNTCSIRQNAENRVFGMVPQIIKLRKKNKKLMIAIAGCMGRISSSRYSTKRDKLFNMISELDIVVRSEEMQKLASLIREIDPKSKIKAIKEEKLEDYFMINPKHASKAQAFLPVSIGCDKFCTYCIVPFSRGREKSRDIDDILNEARTIADKGYKEITLVGQTVNSYGLSVADRKNKHFQNLYKQNKKPFVYLLEELDKLRARGLNRVRFTSPHPKDMSDDLINAMARLPVLMPYLHLPVQSGDDKVLRRMNRTYTIKQYKEIIKKIRKKIPDIAISTDIIVGFCGETEKEFKNSHKLFEELEFEHCYFSQYSERKGTFAAKNMEDNVTEKVKKERWDAINKLLKKISTEKLKRFKGRTVEVIVEEWAKGICIGRSEHYKIVEFPGPKSLIGALVSIKITETKEWVLRGGLSPD
ncbi:MAG: tRNA (N6-isopentenyl adenosine(37)-C2)-methylthiotransferase MiaB [Candidatus Gracilibacteria bacterium]|jgi:tRNA-2-methylthio-N6-dimethylallyladenosine synthase